ncbi:MAG: hypothetical protein KGM16_16455 [Bacteroidota bacterium]|nr:hypothetical protein [Bacteroidota bacterium]
MSLDELFKASKELNYSQSNGMIKVNEMRGPGFFPGCTGTIDSLENISGLRFMILGQDFDTKANHKEINPIKGEIETNTTWRNLRKLLKEVGINEKECFFTNAYMGLRPDNTKSAKTKNTGKSPAAKKGAEGFSDQCLKFFKTQLQIVKPEVVLVLGKETAQFVANAFPECSKWSHIKTLKTFYENETTVFAEVTFDNRSIHFLFVIHPSLNIVNRSKIWGKEEGKEKEQKLLKKLLSGIS